MSPKQESKRGDKKRACTFSGPPAAPIARQQSRENLQSYWKVDWISARRERFEQNRVEPPPPTPTGSAESHDASGPAALGAAKGAPVFGTPVQQPFRAATGTPQMPPADLQLLQPKPKPEHEQPAVAAAPGEGEPQFATLTLPNGESYQLEVLEGCEGTPSVVDVRALYAKTGMFTYDPGFASTAACRSQITYIDGERGVLTHRGYPIEQLAEHSDFYDVSYLLLYGELPSAGERAYHIHEIHSHTMVHQKLIQFLKGFKSDAHPMAIMVGVVGALSAFYHDSLEIQEAQHRRISAYRLISKLPTIASMAYKTSIGQPIVYPRNDLTFAENFLYMLFAIPSEDYIVNPVLVRALEVFLVLHADHEQNASTSTVRIAGSSYANPFACISSGICSLWGPAHGGANEAVLNMLEEIGTKDRIPDFLERARDKADPFRLMGFGHRVYKNYDPRSKIMRKMCYEVLHDLGVQKEPLFELAMELEKIALEDEYFVKRKLFPNVDFYSGIVLKAMGIPRSMYTVLFAVARTVGWVSHWKEMISDPLQRIGRPRQLYCGAGQREFLALNDRPRTDLDGHEVITSLHLRNPSQGTLEKPKTVRVTVAAL